MGKTDSELGEVFVFHYLTTNFAKLFAGWKKSKLEQFLLYTTVQYKNNIFGSTEPTQEKGASLY